MTDDRKPSPSPGRFVPAGSVPFEAVGSLEGAAQPQGLAIAPLLVGEDMLLMRLERKQGLVDPLHSHADHESICHLISGRLRVEIDGESFIAEAGDSWIHPAGVPHRHEALEDSVQIEIKSPPRKTWG
ncbi:MAG: cupin domain-containing protein [Alphaproteobacteria bacterium]|jgi:quercetin dioxygenase-like cupin family protein|nr:cupin domain-containing protein [Alphaproteobacteria bacterium]